MSNIFLTSDTHLSHNRPFMYEPRGFNSIEEHDEAIIHNWNSIVAADDIVYHLGDTFLSDAETGIKNFARLNGQIKIIIGNHDTAAKLSKLAELDNIEIMGYATIIKDGKYGFYLSHYPTKVGGDYNMRDKLWCLCGHSHTNDPLADAALKSYHVELDAHNNYPVALEDIRGDIRRYKEEYFNENR